jgi:hypothetical protein
MLNVMALLYGDIHYKVQQNRGCTYRKNSENIMLLCNKTKEKEIMSHCYLQFSSTGIFSQSLASVSTSTLNFGGMFEVCKFTKVLIGEGLHILCVGCGIMKEAT